MVVSLAYGPAAIFLRRRPSNSVFPRVARAQRARTLRRRGLRWMRELRAQRALPACACCTECMHALIARARAARAGVLAAGARVRRLSQRARSWPTALRALRAWHARAFRCIFFYLMAAYTKFSILYLTGRYFVVKYPAHRHLRTLQPYFSTTTSSTVPAHRHELFDVPKYLVTGRSTAMHLLYIGTRYSSTSQYLSLQIL